MNIRSNISISEVLGVAIGKAFQVKNVESFTESEFLLFWEELKKDEEFIEACKNIVKTRVD